ncbi:thiol:disulfide interchange protein DsbC [Actimicrobium sp. GrIS 1.19]|uniref:DsbC family protein n=1 Tax=Actimicrobium sp. GrIS 1.19 TaxID=3071708 RepID=UPI002DF79C9A|nr:thiol:disulfide interchange protein DsbC [Actimicrobium sp. GrIS 1.19]
MKTLKFALPLLLVAHCAFAETTQETAIKKLIEPKLGDGAVVESVRKTPYSGLFELRVGGEILYTDAEARYLFVGRVLDTKNFKDLTKARVDEINQVKFSDLPLELAVKTVRGDGKRIIAVFEDPDCGYCKRFRQTLQTVDNVTVYTFMYNILSEASAPKSRNVWCAADRSKAWDEWMLKGKEAPVAAAGCIAPNDKVLALGQKLRVTGTPTIFFADGSRIPGAVDNKGLETKFSALKDAASAAR